MNSNTKIVVSIITAIVVIAIIAVVFYMNSTPSTQNQTGLNTTENNAGSTSTSTNLSAGTQINKTVSDLAGLSNQESVIVSSDEGEVALKAQTSAINGASNIK